jgi:membrane-associated phospholipid phosphatase
MESMLFFRVSVRQLLPVFASIIAIAFFLPQVSLAQSKSEGSDHTVPDSENTNIQPAKTSTVMDSTDPSASSKVGERPRASTKRLPPSLERQFATNFIQDQRAIWSSPLRLKRKDAFWIIPAAALTGELLHRDAYLYQKLTPNVNPGTTSKSFTDYAVVGMAGGIAGMYLLGRLHGNEHARETGVLAAEAAVDSLAFSSALKYTLRRERPFNGTGHGDFFVGGGDSFPSTHAITAWSLATVVANEYPGVLTKIGAYGLASGISIARVTGRQHFPTDVVIGSALGYGIGRYVYRKHHDPDLPGMDIGTIIRDKEEVAVQDLASPYVPLDNWIYPGMDRLAALGFVKSSSAGLRPWTRLECARLVQEADDLLQDDSESSGAEQAMALVKALHQEFREEESIIAGRRKPEFNVESLYVRTVGISGPVLNDGYHFGQTIYDDYGRPYSEGVNAIAGVSAWASSGHWAVYLRGEYQYAPTNDGLPLSTLALIPSFDNTPVATNRTAAVNRLRFLDSYVSFQHHNWQFSFGKQSLWWGPGSFGALNLSNNAEPITMVRISRSTPTQLPGILGLLGPIRSEVFVGQLGGQQYVRTVNGFFGPGLNGQSSLGRQPLINGAKFSFKPTPNLEFGFSHTVLWGGPGLPLTVGSFFRSFFLSNAQFGGQQNDPGDRRTGFDFRYAIPGLRQWLILYNDSFSEDEFSPIAYPRRSSMRSGIYMPKLPGMRRLDFRAEGVYTDLPNLRGVGVSYFNSRFLSGYTNFSHIMGDWIGREGSGFTVQSTYWASPQNKVQISYRNVNVNPDFIKGGAYDDISATVNWGLRANLALTASSQYERWRFPAIAADRNSNVTTQLQLTFRPRSHE